MIDWLVGIDTRLFNFLNQGLANPVFDVTMPVITNDWLLRLVFLIIVVALLIWGKRQGRITAAALVLTVLLSDQLSSHLVKPLAARVRPCHVIPSVHLLVNCSQGLSFPSSHAANSFAPSVLMSMTYPKLTWLFLAIAVIISYSRIAVGVHYPLDVLTGAVLGTLAGLAMYTIKQYAYRRLLPGVQTPSSNSGASVSR